MKGEKMKLFLQKLKRAMLIVLVFAMLAPSTNVMAATQRQKAITAYKRYLAQNKITLAGEMVKSSETIFALSYIDNNNIPELVVQKRLQGTNHGAFAVFTYTNGKIIRVMNGNIYEGFRGYYAKTGVIKTRDYPPMGKGIKYTEFFSRLEGVKTITLLTRNHSLGIHDEPYCYYRTGRYDRTKTAIREDYGDLKPATASKFYKLLKEVTKSKKMTAFKFYNNTSANRKKYCK